MQSQFFRQVVVWFNALTNYDEGLYDMPALWVRFTDNGRLQNGRMLDQATLNIEWTNPVAGRSDDVV